MEGKHDKLAELILYVSARQESDGKDGWVGQARALFYADFLFYAQTGRSITGEVYVRRGHEPEPEHLLEARDRLLREHALVLEERPIGRRAVDLSAFTAEEIAVVDHVLERLGGAGESELARRFKAWELAVDGEEIPYQTAFLSQRKPSADDYALARKLAREHIQGAA